MDDLVAGKLEGDAATALALAAVTAAVDQQVAPTLLPESFVLSPAAAADRRRFLPEPAVLGDVVYGPVLALQLAAGPLLAGDLADLF